MFQTDGFYSNGKWSSRTFILANIFGEKITSFLQGKDDIIMSQNMFSQKNLCYGEKTEKVWKYFHHYMIL